MNTRTGSVPVVAAGAHAVPGRGRDHHEDAHVCGPTWFAVADGMGGHVAGAIAARTALSALRGHGTPHSVDDVRRAVAGANRAVHEWAAAAETRGMGTTLTGVAVSDDVGTGVALFHVGDSRCYRLLRGSLTLLTRDHSHVRELVDAGLVDAGAAHRHPLRHVITRALGVDDPVDADISVIPNPVGRLLVCSDGLANALTARAIGRTLTAVGDPTSAARRLVELASARAEDDATALVVDITNGSP